MSEMLTEMVPGQEDSSDLELLQVRGPHLGGLWSWRGHGEGGTELCRSPRNLTPLGMAEACSRPSLF